MEVTILNCFCNDSAISGNPCGVVQHFLGTAAEKQQLAAQLNLPVLVFISHHDSRIPTLEYFYPDAEMPLCIHGTLGAASVLFDIYRVQNFTCQTAAGLLLNLYVDNGMAQISLSISHKSKDFSDIHEIYQMLRLQDDTILSTSLPCQIASVGSPKLLIPITSKKALMDLQPDFAYIKAWSISNNVNGIYVYAQGASETHHFYARGFNPRTGHHEDAATGVAAGTLATCLDMKHISIEQGEALGKPSMIHVTRIDEATVLVGGKVSVIQANMPIGKRQDDE